MMLETCWRALEDAGIDPEGLQGTRTGVYAGMSNNDYRHLILGARENAEAAAGLYSVTGSSLSPAIGRVSFVLGFEGPAMVVDTACSSSLVAVHQAVAGLHRGDADLALVGGVQAILFGRLSALRAKAGMLSPNGRCKTFDAAADGYVRGEGCGIVVLKRLDEAEADGDRIWAVIRGSAVNQDGMGPGLTVPEGPAQQRAIEAALANAGLSPSEVDYLEAHGTGTRVGDPTELGAAAAVYGRDREADRPLLIGSVKTNIGHLESAAGVAGLIKATLALKRGVIPKHLHFETPNPMIEEEGLPLRVTAEATAWPMVDRPCRAGVNSFGFSGTNAHVVLESYGETGTAQRGDIYFASGAPRSVPVPEPCPPTKAEPGRRVRLLTLSGKSEAALRELAGRYLTWLDDREAVLVSESSAAGAPLADLAWTASVGRSHFRHRAGVVFSDTQTLRDGLAAIAAEGDTPLPAPARESPKVAFAYTGQASQWVGMARNIYETEPAARAVLDRCDALLREWRGASLLDVMFGVADTGSLDDPAWTQPSIYALECALTAQWASLGVRPDVVVGHSLGEIAAAQAAGVFTLEEGLGFAARRGDLIAGLPEKGAMAVVFAPEPVVAAAVEEHNAGCEGPGLAMAADNGTNQAISGPEADVTAVLAHFETEDIRTARLRASPAYHSALVDPALDGLEAYFEDVAVAAPEVAMVSTMTGERVAADTRLDGSYWRRQARAPVAFSRAVETLADLDVDVVVELGPHGVLGPMVSLGWPGSAAPAVLSSLRRPSRDESLADVDGSFMAAVGGAYEAGVPLRLESLYAGEERCRVSLPGYAFQRRRHWIEAPQRRRPETGHPLLGVRHESPRGEIDFETELYVSDPAWMDDHRVFDHVLAPGALYGAMAASVGFAEGAGSAVVDDLQMRNPLVFPTPSSSDEDSTPGGRKVQVVVASTKGTPTQHVEIFSKGEGEDDWTLHAEAEVSETATGQAASEADDLDGLRRRLSPGDVAAFYRAKTETGIQLGRVVPIPRRFLVGTRRSRW